MKLKGTNKININFDGEHILSYREIELTCAFDGMEETSWYSTGDPCVDWDAACTYLGDFQIGASVLNFIAQSQGAYVLRDGQLKFRGF